MNVFIRIVKGIFVGAVFSAIAWFLLGTVDVILNKNKFELFVPITAGFFGLVFGGVIGGIIGLIQLNLKIIMITAIAIASLILILLIPSFLSAPENKYLLEQNDYWQILLNLFSFIKYLIATLCVAYIITKIVSPKKANSVELE